MKITDDIKYVGVNDREIDLFEGQYRAPFGMSYNSFVICDEKIAVLDTVGKGFDKEWFEKIENALNGKVPDYLIVQHMEPDHSANIHLFAEKYPDAKIVASAKAFVMMKQFFGTDFSENAVVVGDGDALNLGKHTLCFYTAPMVHWPEVIMTYDQTDGVLFSADAFGKFGALDAEDDWVCEARRYYIGIVGKYGAQVQAVLKKLSSLSIKSICSLHGPVLNENLEYYLNLYNVWSSYGVESEGVVIAYTSIYGNTKRAALLLAEKLKEKGYEKVVVNDLARCDMSRAIEDAFRYGKLVLATTTYNSDIFPFMRTFIEGLLERNYQNRKVAFIENGSWAPMATKIMKGMLVKCKNLDFAKIDIKILSSLTAKNIEEISLLAEELYVPIKVDI